MNTKSRFIFFLFIFSFLTAVPMPVYGHPSDNPKELSALPPGNLLRGISYGNGIFVVVGHKGTIVTSPDAITWSQQNSPVSTDLYNVAFGNGLFVAVGDNGTILTSPDGIDWTLRNSGTSDILHSVAFGNGIFVVLRCCSGHVLLKSTDGINWNEGEAGSSGLFTDLTYANGMFVAVGGSGFTGFGEVVMSPDAVTWAATDVGANLSVDNISVGNGIFLAQFTAFSVCPGIKVCSQFRFERSTDGLDWVPLDFPPLPHGGQSSFANGNFFAFVFGWDNSTTYASPDALTWSAVDTGPYSLRDVFYAAGTYVALAPYTILTSPDGHIWTVRAGAEFNTQPVYRFFNTLTGTHFYTISEDEKDYVIATYPQFNFEGVAFYAYASQAANSLPVFRFYNTLTGTHFYTISEDERDYVIATYPQFNFERVAFYAYTSQAANSLPVYRFFNTLTGTHFYTMSTYERNYVIANYPQFNDEGGAFYAYPE